MAKSSKRGGAKAHRRRVNNRNTQIKGRIQKAEKLFQSAMMEQLEKMREGLSGETENQEFVDVEAVETSESVQLNLGSTNLDPHL
jgi:hypothetical protein